MTRGPLTVAIVGGGIGGLTAALALRRAGFVVKVYEQARDLAEVGAGLQLSPNGVRVLDRLGLLPMIESVAVAAESFEFRRWDDARLISMTQLGLSVRQKFGFGYYQIHRADLQSLLLKALPSDCLEVGRRCVDLKQIGEHVEIHFAEGASARADIVVGADGIHSKVREIFLGKEAPRFTGNVAFRGLVPIEHLAHLGLNRTCTMWMGPGGHFIHYFVAAGKLLNVVFLRDETTWTWESWTDRGDVDELRAGYQGWHATVRSIISAMDSTLKWALFDRSPLPRWSFGRVTLLGDACHPMLPYVAQGAAQAIEDAATLAACLSRSHPDDVPMALERYEKLRLPRVTSVQAMASANSGRFHLPDGPLQRARDAAMAGSFGLTPAIDWLYSYDAEAVHQPPLPVPT
jgi:salicylate hydroxylase